MNAYHLLRLMLWLELFVDVSGFNFVNLGKNRFASTRIKRSTTNKMIHDTLATVSEEKEKRNEEVVEIQEESVLQLEEEEQEGRSSTYFVKHVVLTKMHKWGKLSTYGTPLDDKHGLIPMKTPIADKYIDDMKWNSFTIHDLVHEQWARHGRVVGLMIDLSNHDCIYDYESISVPVDPVVPPASSHNNFTKHPEHEYVTLKYMKHRCISKQCPSFENIQGFSKIVLDYKKQYPSHYIGVHCSYGFNRTGFVVCSFMVEQCGLHPDAAVMLFSNSRRPGIKHAWFVDELRNRYQKKSGEEEDQQSTTDGSEFEHVSESESEPEDNIIPDSI